MTTDYNAQSILNWEKYEAEAKALDDNALEYVIEDCVKTAVVMKGVEASGACKGEGFYWDLYFVHCNERKNRIVERYGSCYGQIERWKADIKQLA